MADWAVQDAKARFSELLRAAEEEPQTITFRGKPKFELRLKGGGLTRKAAGELPRWWTSAPKIPDLDLPPRRVERPRKTGL